MVPMPVAREVARATSFAGMPVENAEEPPLKTAGQGQIARINAIPASVHRSAKFAAGVLKSSGCVLLAKTY